MTRTVLLSIEPSIHYFSQTLTTLGLSSNLIYGQVVEHLANALEQNKVTSLHPTTIP